MSEFKAGMLEGDSGYPFVFLEKVVQRGRKITYGIVQPGEFVSDGVILVRGRDYSFGWRPSSELMKVTPEIDAPYKRSKLKSGDIVLTIVGANTGTVAVVPDWLEGANITQTTARIAVDPTKASPGFVEQVLRSPIGQKDVYRYIKGGAQPGLNLADVEKFRIPLPPLPEQSKIATILSAWDEALEKLQALRAAEEKRFAGVAQRLLEPARAIGRNIPRSNWQLTTFGEVFEERHDRSNGLGPDDVVTVGKYAIRKQSEHFSRSVASKDQSNYWTISPGDFVYDPMSAYYGALGRYDGTQDGLVSPAYRVIRLARNVQSDFMVHLLRSHHIRFLLEARSSQGNKEGKRRLLQRDEFGGIEFNLPPMEVQQEIALRLAKFRIAVSVTERQIELLNRQKWGLMKKLLTGEWRVNLEGAA
jgi:type I restriction enzyme S subunit